MRPSPSQFAGFHNQNFSAAGSRLLRGNGYRDLSTVWITATRGSIAARVTSSWFGLMRPMNQRVVGPIYMEGLEVGEAYNNAVEMILASPELSKYKYMLTVEEDNCPPPDGLLKLYESMDQYDVVQGLYWTKGENGQPMCYGDPNVMPKNFTPQVPPANAVTRYNGLGMGFNLFKLNMFKKLPKPWFKTVQEYTPGVGAKSYTQDLYFYEQAGMNGFKFACDSRVLVGHWDQDNRMMW
jgi:hypothetical protein